MRFFIQIDDGDETVNDNAAFVNCQSKTFAIGTIGDDNDELTQYPLANVDEIIKLLIAVKEFSIQYKGKTI